MICWYQTHSSGAIRPSSHCHRPPPLQPLQPRAGSGVDPAVWGMVVKEQLTQTKHIAIQFSPFNGHMPHNHDSKPSASRLVAAMVNKRTGMSSETRKLELIIAKCFNWQFTPLGNKSRPQLALRKLCRAMLSSIDKEYVATKQELIPGGDIRASGNTWLRNSFVKAGLRRVPRETQIRLAVIKIAKKKNYAPWLASPVVFSLLFICWAGFLSLCIFYWVVKIKWIGHPNLSTVIVFCFWGVFGYLGGLAWPKPWTN